MINGLKLTEILMARKQLQIHHKKLKQISNKTLTVLDESIDRSMPEHQYQQFLKNSQTIASNCRHSISMSLSRGKGFATLTNSQKARLRNKKQNHVHFQLLQLKSITYHKNKKQTEIQQNNAIIYQKLLKIKQRKDLVNLRIAQNQQNLSKKDKKIVVRSPKKMGKDFVYRKRQSMAIQATNAMIGQRLMNQTGYYDHQKDLNDFYKTRQILDRMGKFTTVNRLMKSPAPRRKSLPKKLPKLYTQASEA